MADDNTNPKPGAIFYRESKPGYFDILVVEAKPPYADEDMFYRESDSDGEDIDDVDNMKMYEKIVESGYHPSIPLIPEEPEDVEERNCLKVPLCHFHQHDEPFQGKPLFELHKVKAKYNDKLDDITPLVGARLHGQIQSYTACRGFANETPFPVTYYHQTDEEALLIHRLDSHNYRTLTLPLSGPCIDARPPITEYYPLHLRFSFKLDNGTTPFDDGPADYTVVDEEDDDYDPDPDYYNPLVLNDELYLRTDPDRSDRSSGACIVRKVLGNKSTDRILMLVNYSVCAGAWAAVKVRVLNKEVRRFHGIIVSRPCVYVSRIRLLSIPNTDEAQEVDHEESSGGFIKLTRSVVVVPAYASLIVGAALYDPETGEVICRGRNFFPAAESGSQTKRITYNGVETLEVTVDWNCKLIDPSQL